MDIERRDKGIKGAVDGDRVDGNGSSSEDEVCYLSGGEEMGVQGFLEKRLKRDTLLSTRLCR